MAPSTCTSPLVHRPRQRRGMRAAAPSREDAWHSGQDSALAFPHAALPLPRHHRVVAPAHAKHRFQRQDGASKPMLAVKQIWAAPFIGAFYATDARDHSHSGHGDLTLVRTPSRLAADGALATRLSGWFAHLAGSTSDLSPTATISTSI
ncbi:hypothetical protein DFH06DRAFT_1319478 [Mycena polygramma]|nr:hypothetical protein DFH06DRAFT_1319478 [Mycena polygramma]